MIGQTVGPFRVLDKIGEGGMGEVYKARDTKLDRDVALKILPDAFVNDPERLARFQREAKVLAALNHPNIAAIYGLEEGGDSPALVLEYVEGPTLQEMLSPSPSPGLRPSSPPAGERTKGKPLPLEEALAVARQIAEALEAAHEQGIIHRDLKPANVKVKDDGTVKVLDFGLAKALGPDLSDTEAANSPTMTMTAAATKMGVIMGTAAYMSPEQARGKTVDKRADIWAFGVVLFEMLTGRQVFAGTDISLTLAAVLRQEMDWTELPSETPHSVRRLLRRCLERDHRRRLPEIGTARLEIDEADAAPEVSAAVATTPIAHPALWQRPVSIAAALVLALAVGGLAVSNLTPPPASVPVVRVPIPLGADQTFSSTGRHSVAISPDGRRIVYVANGGLWLRPMDQLQATAMAATFGDGNARSPFFSPDGQWVGYHSGEGLKKVSISGGAPVVLGDADNPWGATWGADDAILFGQGPAGIWQVSGTGGSSEQLIAVDDGAQAHGPQMLPGGEWVLFTLRPPNTLVWDEAQIVVQSVATGERRVLIAGGRDGRYVATGHLVYTLNGGLFAVPFDLGARDVTGGPVSLIEGILDGDVRTGAAHVSLSNTGSLVYIPGSAGAADQIDLVWVNRTGDIEPVGVEPGAFGQVRVSPDGTRLAVDTVIGQTPDLWIYDLSRSTLTRLTFDDGFDQRPLWTPDGSRVVFSSSREGGGLFWKAADGTGDVERLLETSEFTAPESWSADGRLLFTQNPGNIGVLTVEGERTMELLLDTGFVELYPDISPDGRWIAYQSDESGQSEVYVRPFPDVDAGKWQVSNAGGFDAVWSPDGRELFFAAIGSPQTLMVAQVETEPTFSATTPERLFDLGPFDLTTRGRDWDIAPDGDRFVFRTRGAAQTSGEAPFNGLIFVQNWFEELKARVPVP